MWKGVFFFLSFLCVCKGVWACVTPSFAMSHSVIVDRSRDLWVMSCRVSFRTRWRCATIRYGTHGHSGQTKTNCLLLLNLSMYSKSHVIHTHPECLMMHMDFVGGSDSVSGCDCDLNAARHNVQRRCRPRRKTERKTKSWRLWEMDRSLWIDFATRGQQAHKKKKKKWKRAQFS